MAATSWPASPGTAHDLAAPQGLPVPVGTGDVAVDDDAADVDAAVVDGVVVGVDGGSLGSWLGLGAEPL
jgi:hypothetical protein